MLIIHSIFTRNITVCVHSHCLWNKKNVSSWGHPCPHKKAPAVRKMWVLANFTNREKQRSTGLPRCTCAGVFCAFSAMLFTIGDSNTGPPWQKTNRKERQTYFGTKTTTKWGILLLHCFTAQRPPRCRGLYASQKEIQVNVEEKQCYECHEDCICLHIFTATPGLNH